MKKLLIAMSAAAMFSLCAKADDPTLLGSTDFESGYVVGNPIGTEAVDPGSASSLIFWYGTNSESEIVEESAGGNKYLKVDTPEELTRKTAALNEDTNPVKPVDIGDGDITISSKVQFTAADEAPEATEGDKLIVWAKAPDEDNPTSTTTNLVVTAKTADGVVTNFVTDTLIEADTWYVLEIKAVAAGSLDDGNASAAFTVSIAPEGSTPVPVTVGGQEATFKSLLNDNVTGAQTITSIGFKGTGAVDDIVFAKNEAVVVPDVTVTVEAPTGVTLYNELGIDLASNVITTNAGATVTIYVADDDGTKYSSVSSSVGTVGTWNSSICGWPITYETTAEQTAVTMTITVTEGGQSTTITPDKSSLPGTVTITGGLNASYEPGETIDPTAITATTSKPGYEVAVKIYVKGVEITSATTLQAGDTITVTATETAIEYTITYTYEDVNGTPVAEVDVNANPTTFTVNDAVTIDMTQISKTGYTVTSVTPASIAQGTTENQTVVVVLTADAPQTTYTVTAAAVEGATVNFSTTDPVVSGTTVTFTIEVTATDKEVDTVSDGTNTLTADNGTYSVTVADANIVITVTLKDKTTPAGDWPATWNNGAAATPAQAAAFTEWAKTNDATAEDAQAAFLTGQSVANYKEVAFTSITIVDNKVVLTENVDLSNANGVVKIKYGATPTSLTNTAELGAELPATAPALFYKIVVDFQ